MDLFDLDVPSFHSECMGDGKKSVEKMVLKSKTSRDNLTLFTLQLVQARFYLDFRNLKLCSSR